MASYNNQYIDELYKAQQTQKVNALNNARAAAELSYRSQLPEVNQSYDRQRAQIDTTARVNAIGNNERLASLGLAGGSGAAPTSGYSETSRQRDNTNLRTGLNSANLQQQGAINQINRDVLNSNLTFAQQKAQQLADIAAQRGSAQISQYNNDRSYENTVAQQALAQKNWQTEFSFNKKQYTDTMDAQRKKAVQEEFLNTVGLINGNSTYITYNEATKQAAVATDKSKDLRRYISKLNINSETKKALYGYYGV